MLPIVATKALPVSKKYTAAFLLAQFRVCVALLGPAIVGIGLATSEAVANAILHGQPPNVVRIWEQPDRMTVTVTDTGTGTGPVDPYVGRLPPTGPSGGGVGLWISHQLVDITHRRHPGGYTIRMTAARPAQYW